MKFLALILFIFLAETVEASYRKVTIKNNVHVSAEQVRLRDLLVDPDLVTEEEGAYAIVEAPKAKKYYTLRNLAFAMQQHQSLKDLQLYGSGGLVKVVRVADEAMLSDLQESIKKSVAAIAPWKDYIIDVKLGASEIQKVATYTDADSYKITKVENGTRMRTVKLSVALYKNKKAYRKIQLTVGVSRKAKVIVLDEAKRRGDVIQKADLSVVEQWVTGDLKGLLQDPKQVIGYELRYARTKGQFLRSSDILQPTYTLKNQKVKAQTRFGALIITAEVTALARARRGDLVRVRNEKSGEIFQARVIADRLVEVQ